MHFISSRYFELQSHIIKMALKFISNNIHELTEVVAEIKGF